MSDSKSEEPFWKKELKAVLGISLTFFVFFILFMFLKKAMLGQYNIEIYPAGTALIGSLIMGKVVLLTDSLVLKNRLNFLTNIYKVFVLSFIYLLGYVLFSFVEHLIIDLIDGQKLNEAFDHSLHHLLEFDFLTSLVIVFIAFLLFNTFWIIRNAFGVKALFKLFFAKP